MNVCTNKHKYVCTFNIEATQIISIIPNSDSVSTILSYRLGTLRFLTFFGRKLRTCVKCVTADTRLVSIICYVFVILSSVVIKL